MGRALFIVDVQNDFTEGGALGVAGGAAVAQGVTDLLREHADDYDVIVASRDWHDGDNDNGGHFATDDEPDFESSWPPHCVAGTTGADYHPAFDTARVTFHVHKGQGRPAYSMFEGLTESGASVHAILDQYDIHSVDITGIATDYCVRASALDALEHGQQVRVLTSLIAGVAPATSEAALAELADAGAELVA